MIDQWIYYFGEAPPPGFGSPAEVLGGKGSSLSELFDVGFPVPPGFTISTKACRYYLDHKGMWPMGLREQLKDNLSRLEADTDRCFGSGLDPLLLAVRSGASVSLPGMMDTILNCGLHLGLASQFAKHAKFWSALGNFIADYATLVVGLSADAFGPASDSTDLVSLRIRAERLLKLFENVSQQNLPSDPFEILVNCINGVFRSWRSERAVAYRKRNCVSHLAGTAVNVQAMFPADVSGVLFTKDPTDPSSDEMVAEYCSGLGTALVSGSVTPQRHRFRRSDLNIVESQPKNTLSQGSSERIGSPHCGNSNEWLQQVCREALKIERHFGKPVDVEWSCACDGRFAVLQARPIAELELTCEAEKVRAEALCYLGDVARDQRRVWVAHNLGESLRFPTPLTWDLTKKFMSSSGGVGLMYRDLGYCLARADGERGFLELICGSIYADARGIAEMFWPNVPLEYDLQALKRDPSQLGRPPNRLDIKRINDRLLLILPRVLWTLLRVHREIQRLTRSAATDFEQRILPAYFDYVRQKRDQDLRSLPTQALLKEFRQRCDHVLCQFARDALKPGFLGGLQFQAVEGTLAQLLGPERGASLARDLTAGLEDVSWKQNVDLGRVACGELLLDKWLGAYGHRAPNELELMEPRWREDAQRLNDSISRLTSRTAPAAIYERARKRREEAEEKLLQELTDAGGSSFYEDVKRQLAIVQALLPYREAGRHYLMMGYELIRNIMVELGNRWELGDGVFFLQADELDDYEVARLKLQNEIEGRKKRWRSLRLLHPPEVIDSLELRNLEQPHRISEGERLACIPLANGIANGRALVATIPDQPGYAGPDQIVVCPSADPAWLPALVDAAGLVVERGGVLSHAAVAARNLGIPAVALSDATRILIPGEQLCLDAGRGTITRIDRKC